MGTASQIILFYGSRAPVGRGLLLL